MAVNDDELLLNSAVSFPDIDDEFLKNHLLSFEMPFLMFIFLY